MFDSPIERCPVCGAWVLTDQTQKECAREHGCSVARCPLQQYFTGVDFSRTAADAAANPPLKAA